MYHIELWAGDVEAVTSSFNWLFTTLGWTLNHDPARPTKHVWRRPSGVYLVLERSPDISGPPERTHAGLNHLALHAIELMIG